MYALEVREQIGGDQWFTGLAIQKQEGRPPWFVVIRAHKSEEDAYKMRNKILKDIVQQYNKEEPNLY